jgi:glycosyltransferase involved in cell wall biosynthesis
MADILIASDIFPPDFTGAGLRALRLAQRMGKKHGLSFQALCKGHRNIHENAGGVEVSRIMAVKEHGILFPFYLVQTFFLTNNYLFRNRKKIDIIHFFSFSWMNRMMMLANVLFYKKKTILEITLDGSDDPVSLISGGKKNMIFHRLTKSLLKKIDAFISGSADGLKSCKAVGIDEKKVIVLPRPCDVEEFASIGFNKKHELRRKLGLPIDKFILINVGRIQPRKNQEFIVRCLNLLKNKDYFAVFIGPYVQNDEYFLKIKEYAKNNHLEKQILFVGQRKNINQYLIASDLFVFASKNEGFPNAVAESITSGLPVVTTYLDCIKHFITENTGIMIRNYGGNDKKMMSEFTKSIVYIHNRHKFFKRDFIRGFGIKNFSPEKIDVRYYELYLRLLNEECE